MNVIQVGDVLERKHAFTDYKSLGFEYLPNFMYSEGVSPKFWLKIWKLSAAHDHSHGHRLLKLLKLFGKTEFKTLIGNVLDRQQAFIDYNNMDITYLVTEFF